MKEVTSNIVVDQWTCCTPWTFIVLCQLYLIKTGKKFTKTTTKPHAVQVKVKEDKGTISGAELCRIPGVAGMDHGLALGCDGQCIWLHRWPKAMGFFRWQIMHVKGLSCEKFPHHFSNLSKSKIFVFTSYSVVYCEWIDCGKVCKSLGSWPW